MSDSGINDQSAPNTAGSDTGLPKVSPGARLAAYREERGWTIEQVASQLNLAPRQIVAIEHDDYAALPGMPIVRGFVRAYAKLLKVDPAPLLAELGGEAGRAQDTFAPRKSLSEPFSDTRLPSMNEHQGLSSKWVVGTLLAVLLGVAIWAGRQGGEQAAVPASADSAVKNGAANTAGDDTVQAQPEAKASAQDAVPPIAAENAAPAETGSGTGETAPAAAATAPAATPAPTTSGKDTLQLTVREESWIEVRRAGSKEVVLSRILKAGETENVEVTEAVFVVIGNVAGVDVTLRGTPVELKSVSKSNVARLTLK